METTTQSHRYMLLRICTLYRVAGWAMIAMGIFGVGVIVFWGWSMLFGPAHALSVGAVNNPFEAGGRLAHLGVHTLLLGGAEAVGRLLTGLVVLGMAQFIRYVVEEGAEPRWLLRNGHIILCLLALSMLLTIGVRSLLEGIGVAAAFADSPGQTITWGMRLEVASTLLLGKLPALTKVLCVLGIAAILRNVLPILAESKTLA